MPIVHLDIMKMMLKEGMTEGRVGINIVPISLGQELGNRRGKELEREREAGVEPVKPNAKPKRPREKGGMMNHGYQIRG